MTVARNALGWAKWRDMEAAKVEAEFQRAMRRSDEDKHRYLEERRKKKLRKIDDHYQNAVAALAIGGRYNIKTGRTVV